MILFFKQLKNSTETELKIQAQDESKKEQKINAQPLH